MNQERPVAAEQRAWELLVVVEDHPQVQKWLHRAQASSRSRIRSLAFAAVLVVGIGVAATAGYLQLRNPHYETAISEQRDVLLGDGSRVTLNTNTALSIRYTDAARQVQLERGEAIFAVKADPARPFEVAAGETVTRALGTEFNVDLRRHAVKVSVLEGVVRVSTPDQPVRGASDARPALALTKGRAAEFNFHDQRMVEDTADLQRIQAWRARRLEFTDTPLRDALAEFNRYSVTPVVIGTPELESRRLSGVFRIGDVEAFLFSLRETLGVQTLQQADEVIVVAVPADNRG